jgi:hypothetical protein|mmetsp:Transcript_23193/g.42040  ORF Transcript_23193/g.42040 Transcript_23193/m.42040 type:complete len:127 (+) Transcript_23193:321-701(+)|eukprot:CAMPEP_0202495500 /NCGR_PEP_ID=MMETSP1361-20130828/16713_1 /ASSEMBLY_ACC=CAM_ASM_000849 /TAXON_ID=210615 /ORGANISM="Staurosira complex sp., Strain CCMP2646" /LENGTH=126 /DNA_ID=CAMNT_0049126539 /DNA_START=257 /DNA_END=637 /DNA_ORIENTATION=+
MSSFENYGQVKAVVDMYVEGIKNGDASLIEKAFHPRAYMMGHGEKLGFRGHFPIDKLVAVLKDNPTLAGPTYEASITSIQITKDVGVVVLEEHDFHGCNFINYLSVSKLEGRWCITNKTYTTTSLA